MLLCLLCRCNGVGVGRSFFGSDAHGARGIDQILHHLAADDEPCCCGNKSVAGGNVAALSTLAHILVGTDAVEAAGDGVIFDLLEWLLVAVDHLEMRDMQAAQLFAYDFCQRVHLGLVDVSHPEGGGVELVGGSHARDDGDVEGVAALDELKFCGHRVYAVHDIVILAEVDLVGVGGHVKHLMLMHDATAVDVMDTCLGNVDLVLTDGGDERIDLPVDIGEADAVVVKEVYLADTAARQHFHHISSDASDAEDGYTRAAERVDGGLAKKQLCTGKLILHLCIPSNTYYC